MTSQNHSLSNREIVAVLNRLLVIHYRSLPMYLSYAAPWTKRENDDAAKALRNIVADQQSLVERITHQISRLGGVPSTGGFPMEFTSKHDLSIDYLLRELVAHGRRDLAAIEKCVGQLPAHSAARALAEEAQGMAQAHLESLERLAGQRTAA